MNIAIIFAGGVGQRLKLTTNTIPKQFLKVHNTPIIIHTLNFFQAHNEIDKIYIAIHPDYYEYMENLAKRYSITKIAGITNGGKTGQDSIYNALKLAATENPEDSIVLIHDGVRPNITPEVISRSIKCAKENGNAITCMPCSETILISENHTSPTLIPYRKNTFIAQAPQSFHLGEILEAHEKMRKINPDYTNIVDSCTLFDCLGKKNYMIEGNRGNIKITTLEDLYILRALLEFNDDSDGQAILR